MIRKSYELEDVGGNDRNNEDSHGSKRKVVECTIFHMVAVVLVCCIVTTAVALMVYYLTDRPGLQRATVPSLEGTSTPPPPTPTSQLMAGRLPTDVLPRRYEITLRPYLYDDDLTEPGSKLGRVSTFDARVEIKVECMQPTDEITLHAANLTIHGNPTVRDADYPGDDKDLFHSYTTVPEHFFIVIKLKESMTVHKNYLITMNYSGEITNEGPGAIVCKETNNKLTMGTFFEPTYARQLLPCFDEPSFKAAFDVRIEHRREMTALSNGMEIETVELDSHWSRTYFKRVLAMPTYLLAMAVHEYENVSTISDNGCLIRVWLPPDMINKSSTALNGASSLQTFFDRHFDNEYPLEKSDHFGLSCFSAAGAVETWGLVIYVPEALTSEDGGVPSIITHEIAHFWFGNLVTMEWWDDLWLKEGFATYMTVIGGDFLEPEANMYENYPARLNFVKRWDGQHFFQALKRPVPTDKSSSAIWSQYQAAYSKGSAVVYMMQQLLSGGVFEQGIRNYLKERSYKNVNSNHLWEELTYADREYGNHDVKKIMDTYTLQPGVPIVNLTRTGNLIEATQKRFYAFPGSPEEGQDVQRYYIPLTYVHKSNLDLPKGLMLEPDNEKTTFELKNALDSDWYLANYGQRGYYYVNYDLENWQRIVDQAKEEKDVFSELDQTCLVNDATALVGAGILDEEIEVLLKLYFLNETSPSTKESILASEMERFRMKRRRSSEEDVLLSRVFESVGDLYSETGWSKKGDELPVTRRQTSPTRFDVTTLACYYDIGDCVKTAKKLFDGFMRDPQNNNIRTAFRSLVYCNAIRYGGQAEWDLAWRRAQDAATNPMETARWRLALTCSTDLAKLKSYSETLLNLSPKDVIPVLTALADNFFGHELAWDFAKVNWDWMYSQNRPTVNLLADLLEEMTSSFDTEEKLQELLQFGDGREFGVLQPAFRRAVATTKANIQWVADHGAFEDERSTRFERND